MNSDLVITLVAGARPNFVKIAALVEPLKQVGFTTRICHTGQHYDERMSDSFFEQLQIPKPDVNLGVGSGTHVYQLAETMRYLEQEFRAYPPQAVIVVGDVNSTLAAALTANKMNIPVAHVEAGLRSFDRTMPEELNRVLVDALAEWLFVSEPSGVENLRREGVASNRIFHVGNVMIDTLLRYLPAVRSRQTCQSMGLLPMRYALLTLHRPGNVDCLWRLREILSAMQKLSEVLTLVFPVHPRTLRRIEEFDMGHILHIPTMRVTGPLTYLDMLSLLDTARLVLTDSGGVQEETTALRVPCLTLRDNTERPVTITHGSNRLVKCEENEILQVAHEVLQKPERLGQIPELWDGKASERIAVHLKQFLT